VVYRWPSSSATRPPGRSAGSKLVTDDGGAFKGAAFIASRPELLHIRTRRKSPGQNGVRERAFGSLKYEHLYRMEIETLQDLPGKPTRTGRCSTTSGRTRPLPSTSRSKSIANHH
jgi:transposase InsO family protein